MLICTRAWEHDIERVWADLAGGGLLSIDV